MNIESVVPVTHNIDQVWKTVKLGTNLKTSSDIRAALKQMRVYLSRRGNVLFKRKRAFTVSSVETTLELTSVSVEDLGFQESASYREIIAKAMGFGLQLCPSEVGPQLRLQYLDQSGCNYIIGMEPVIISGEPFVFMLHNLRNKRLCLNTVSANPDAHWDTRYRFVFLCPSK